MLYTSYFYGQKISEYGRNHGFVDYRALAGAFDAVLNNTIYSKGWELGEWEQVSGFIDNSEAIEELRETIEAIEADIEELEGDDTKADFIEDARHRIEELEDEIADLENEEDDPGEVYQWYIVNDGAVSILEEAGELVYYNEALDVNLWGVTHWGTSWDYVLTNIPCQVEE